MYYDRRLPEPTLSLLTGPLAWLLPYLHTPQATAALGRLDFRRNRGGRKHGGIQVYLGRTSPLEVLGTAHGHVRLRAHARHKALSPDLFGRTYTPDELAALEPALRAHLGKVAAEADPSFLTSEARPHGGLMRRYGVQHTPDAPFLAVDSEVRPGFYSTPERERFVDGIRTALGVDGRIPSKLDALGILPDGRPALVEVKKPGGDIRSACFQLATYQLFFQGLAATDATPLPEVMLGMVDQKQRVGLLPTGHVQIQDVVPVPIIAAPDPRPDWLARWRADTAARADYGALMDDLTFWRLSDDGEVVEQVQP